MQSPSWRNTKRTIERLKIAEPYVRQVSKIDPATTALVIIDMQIIFADLWSGADNERDLKRLKDLVKVARTANCLIVRTQHGHTNPEIDGGMLHQWWSSSIMAGSPVHDFMPDFQMEDGDILISKKRYSAFLDTPLEEILRGRGIKTVIIAGVLTNLCCETTARDAFVRDFEVIFLIDGTATQSEAMQRSSLLNLGFGFAYLQSCREIQELLEKPTTASAE